MSGEYALSYPAAATPLLELHSLESAQPPTPKRLFRGEGASNDIVRVPRDNPASVEVKTIFCN